MHQDTCRVNVVVTEEDLTCAIPCTEDTASFKSVGGQGCIFRGEVLDKPIDVLYDTGATTSVMSEEAWNGLEKPKQLVSCRGRRVSGAGGESLEPLGLAHLELKLGHHVFSHPFLVCKHLVGSEMIVGNDMQRKYQLGQGWEDGKFALTIPHHMAVNASLQDLPSLHAAREDPPLQSQQEDLGGMGHTEKESLGPNLRKEDLMGLVSKSQHQQQHHLNVDSQQEDPDVDTQQPDADAQPPDADAQHLDPDVDAQHQVLTLSGNNRVQTPTRKHRVQVATTPDRVQGTSAKRQTYFLAAAEKKLRRSMLCIFL